MDNNIVIRKIKKSNILAVANIRFLGWKTAYKGIVDDEFLDSLDENELIEKFKSNYLSGGFIVAEQGEEIIGFCRYFFDNSFSANMNDIDCELLAIYIRPDKKHMGVGKKLFAFVITEFYQANKNKMILWCIKDNKPSIDFYIKRGGNIETEKKVLIGKKEYTEVGIVYNVKELMRDKV